MELSDGHPSSPEWYEGLIQPLLSPALGLEDSTALMFPIRYAVLGYLGMTKTLTSVPKHIAGYVAGVPAVAFDNLCSIITVWSDSVPGQP